MIKLFSLKQQQKDGEQTSKVGTNKKTSPAQLRIQKGSFNILVFNLLFFLSSHQTIHYKLQMVLFFQFLLQNIYFNFHSN